MADQRRLGLIKVADIVLGRILGAALVQELPHRMLQDQRVTPFGNDVFLVEDVAEEMAVVDLVPEGASISAGSCSAQSRALRGRATSGATMSCTSR